MNLWRKKMENIFEVSAELRTDEGKGASRRLRHAGLVPAIVYGGDDAPISVSIDHNKFLRHLAEDAFYAHILTLNVDGKKQQVVLKDLQRHPASDVKIMHADFLRIDANQTMTMTVPLHFVGEEAAVGVKAGGVVSHLMVDVEVACLPKDLPEFVEVDVANLENDSSIHLSELVLPEGVTLVALSHPEDHDLAEGEHSSHDQAVVSIHTPRGAADEDESEEAEEATEE
jgi:large subunit ribosomal protein L25